MCLLSPDWLTMSNQSQQLYNWSLLRGERYVAILLTSAKIKHISLFVFWRNDHVNFDLLEEGTREFQLIGRRYTWISFFGGRYMWISAYWMKVHVNFVFWRKVHVNFGLLEEGTREVWFIGGRCTWIVVYWGKVHVNCGLLEEGTREFWFIGGRYTWILVYWRKIHVNFGLLGEGTRKFWFIGERYT
jgi:hypothetical protein